MAVQHRHQTGVGAQIQHQPRQMGFFAPFTPVPIQPVSRCHRQKADAVTGKIRMRGSRLARQGAGVDDGPFRRLARFHPPVGSGQHVAAETFGHLPLGLFVRQCRQAQIYGPAVVGLHMVKPPAHDFRQFVGKRRLETGQARLAHADQGRGDGLVRAAFGRQ